MNLLTSGTPLLPGTSDDPDQGPRCLQPPQCVGGVAGRHPRRTAAAADTGDPGPGHRSSPAVAAYHWLGDSLVEEFAGKTAVVTGAGSGMGKAFALRWGAEGMNVVIGDIQVDALEATVAELDAAGVPVLGLRTDVSSLGDIEALADAAEARFGAIHLVNNNAGVEGYLDGPIWSATAKD